MLTTVAAILLTVSLAASAEDAGAPANDSAARDGDALGTPDPGAAAGDILDLDLDQLTRAAVVVPAFDVQVTSVTRSESTVGKSPAAVFVITQEMIRRSGVTSLPEALRMAPGLEVAKNTNNQWAITARGFNSRYSGKLLVMIDGRSVYNPIFSGVWWEVQDYPLQDIERIEVIRGPGATIWGENAVNGVINIITKAAKDTQGVLISSGGGDIDESINTVRFGGQSESGWSYRVFARQTERDNGFLPTPTGAHDDWRMGHVGFRSDRVLDDYDNSMLTIQGDVFTSDIGNSGFSPVRIPPSNRFFVENAIMDGGNILGRWSRSDDDSSSFVQCYYDRLTRDDFYSTLVVNTWDIEAQHRFRLRPGNHLTLGANFRWFLDSMGTYDDFVWSLTPEEQSYGRGGVTIQDEIEVVEDRFTLFVGTKLSGNTFTGFEYQPGIRGIWTIDPQQAVWASVSRAVRLPSRVERGMFKNAFDPTGPAYVPLSGSPEIEAENLTAYEMGYRAQPWDYFSWDVATFYNRYTDLIGVEFVGFHPTLPFFIPSYDLAFGNVNDAQTYGVETSFTLDMTDNWRLRGWYSVYEVFASGAGDPTVIEGNDPQNQAYLMSSWDLTKKWELDVMGRYVDSLPTLNVNPYISLDARVGYRLNERWEFSLVGQNLLDGHHREFKENYVNDATEVPRGVYFQGVWRH